MRCLVPGEVLPGIYVRPACMIRSCSFDSHFKRLSACLRLSSLAITSVSDRIAQYGDLRIPSCMIGGSLSNSAFSPTFKVAFEFTLAPESDVEEGVRQTAKRFELTC